ncbi:MAG: hypothetical protein ACE15C_03590 [Phycisphaerae bacterium]
MDIPIRAMLRAIWQAEKGTAAPDEVIDKVVKSSVLDGQLSFRRAVQNLTVELSC